MKVEKTQDPSIFLATYWKLIVEIWRLDLIRFDFFHFENWRIWTIFPMKNPLELVEITFFK
jgi:hypothetical protein